MPQVDVIDLAADFILAFRLSDEGIVFSRIAGHLFHRKLLTRLELDGDEDLRTRTGSDLLGYTVAG